MDFVVSERLSRRSSKSEGEINRPRRPCSPASRPHNSRRSTSRRSARSAHRADPLSSAQALNCACTLARSRFEVTVSAISSPASRRHSTTSRRDEPVPAEEAQHHLPGIAAEPAAALRKQFEQPDLVGGRPLRQELAEAAVLPGDVLDEAGIGAHRHDLGAVADDARVLHQGVPEVIRLQRQRARLEAEERLLEPRPLGLDHAPRKARRKHPPGHFRQDTVVAELGERLRIGLGRQQAGQRLGPALALLGTGANGLERGHGGGPLGEMT